MKKKTDQTLREVMQDMFREFNLTPKLQETQIKSVWEKIMGPSISTYTSSIRLKDGTLTITIVSASLKQELSYGKETIRKSLNDELGPDVVKEIIIR